MVIPTCDPELGLKKLEHVPSLRDYQKKVFLDVMRNDHDGINSLVVLPTGSGKTRIASTVVQHFLQRADKIDSIVVFLALSIQLVDQQRRLIAADLNLDDPTDINVIHSGACKRVCRKQYWFAVDVSVHL